MVRNLGSRIRVLGDRDLDEIVQIQRMLVPAAINDITERGLITNFAPLSELFARTAAAAADGDWVGFLATDHELHLGIRNHLGDVRLMDIVGRLRDQRRL
jgi:DNA-binding GntR family transcriptional regulator